MTKPAITPLSPSRQIAFHQLLVSARKTWLMDALKDALKRAPPKKIKEQLSTYVPADVQQILAAAGVRDEYVFPVPAVLEAKPTLIGYYRLLLGIPQKSFYQGGTGMGQFKSMESRGLLKPGKRPDLEGFCAAMGQSLAELVRQMSPKRFTQRDVSELPLLTLGSQFQEATTTRLASRRRLMFFSWPSRSS